MLNVMPDANNPESTYDILQLVSKNRKIPDSIEELTPETQNIILLKQAIKDGDASSGIWNDPHCNLYLLYLMGQNSIPYWEGITAYAYLMAKMQYTSAQNLREEDADVKFNYQVAIEPLVKSKEITELGKHYLNGVCDDLAKVGFLIKFADLEEYVLNQPPIEQWLISAEFNPYNTYKPNSDRLMKILLDNLPFLQITPDSSDEDTTMRYLVPSSSVINFLLGKISADPMQMKPIFGEMGLEKLYEWHEADFHPVALYATQIKSNPKKADGYRCGPFPMWLHDVAHTFWASMLSKEDRLFIFQKYIPALKELHQEAEQYSDKIAVYYLDEAIKNAYDFDLTDIRNSADKKTRLNHYIRGTFSKNPHSFIYDYMDRNNPNPIGERPGDGLFFLLNKFLNNSNGNTTHQGIYQTILSFVDTDNRNESVVKRLCALSKSASKNPDDLFANSDTLDISEVNWSAWGELLASPKTSEKIWKKVSTPKILSWEIDYKLNEMLEKGLNFYHPYLPLTENKRTQFLNFIQEKIGKNPVSCASDHASNSQSSFFSTKKRTFCIDLITSQSHQGDDLKTEQKTFLTVLEVEAITKLVGILDAPALIATLEAFDIKNINVGSSDITFNLNFDCLPDFLKKLNPISKSGTVNRVSLITDGRMKIVRIPPEAITNTKSKSSTSSLISLPVEKESQDNSSKKLPSCIP